MSETDPTTEFKLLSFDLSVVGKRAEQQDCVLTLPDLRLFAVADGMGGHLRGADASHTAIRALRGSIAQHAGRPSIAGMRDAFMEANDAVAQMEMGRCPRTSYGDHKMSCGCMPPGTTLTALWFTAHSVIIGHVGDCRAYRYTGADAEPTVLTREHRRWGGLSSYVGIRHTIIDPEIIEKEIAPGHVFLLASDGLWESLPKTPPEDARAVLTRAMSVPVSEEKIKNLVSTVENRSKDNITALLVEVS